MTNLASLMKPSTHKPYPYQLHLSPRQPLVPQVPLSQGQLRKAYRRSRHLFKNPRQLRTKSIPKFAIQKRTLKSCPHTLNTPHTENKKLPHRLPQSLASEPKTSGRARDTKNAQ